MKYALLLILCGIYSTSFSQGKKLPGRHSDNPSARDEYEYLRLRDPQTNEIPPLITQKEYEFASKLPKHNPFGGKSNILQSSDWQSLGPWNQSGRVQAIGIDILNEAN